MNTKTCLHSLLPLWKGGKVRLNPEHFVIAYDDVVFHCLHWWLVYSCFQPIPWWCHLSFQLSLIPQIHRGTPPHGDLWLPATWQAVPLGHNEHWMFGHICRGLPGMDQAVREDTRCDVNENMWSNAENRVDWCISISSPHCTNIY